MRGRRSKESQSGNEFITRKQALENAVAIEKRTSAAEKGNVKFIHRQLALEKRKRPKAKLTRIQSQLRHASQKKKKKKEETLFVNGMVTVGAV